MSLYTELLSQGVNPMYFHEGLIKRFEPEEIRQTIQDLLCQPELVEMARALGEAGLAIYPESEDILAINALMAMLRKDWEQMLEYTQTLLTVRSDKTSADVYLMMVNALIARLDYQTAFSVINEALARYPDNENMLSINIQLLNILHTSGLQHHPQ